MSGVAGSLLKQETRDSDPPQQNPGSRIQQAARPESDPGHLLRRVKWKWVRRVLPFSRVRAVPEILQTFARHVEVLNGGILVENHGFRAHPLLVPHLHVVSGLILPEAPWRQLVRADKDLCKWQLAKPPWRYCPVQMGNEVAYRLPFISVWIKNSHNDIHRPGVAVEAHIHRHGVLVGVVVVDDPFAIAGQIIGLTKITGLPVSRVDDLGATSWHLCGPVETILRSPRNSHGWGKLLRLVNHVELGLSTGIRYRFCDLEAVVVMGKPFQIC